MTQIIRFLPAVVLSVLLTAVVAVDAWLLLGGGVQREVLILVLGVQLLLLLAAVWITAAVLELRVFRPMRQLQDHLGVFLHSDSDHRLEIPPRHRLGELPQLIEELGRRLSRERLETVRAMDAAAARIEHRKSRLEAILRDLHEGVIVCNDDHRIVLFNHAAAAFLEPAGPVGLHRPIATLMNGIRLRREYARLRRRFEKDPESSLATRFTEESIDGRRIDARMSLIVEPEAACTGYVLSFTPGKADGGEVRSDRRPGILSDRPEFYDFSLFEAQRSDRDLARPLGDLDYVVFDTETTGLDPSKGDRIVQISGVRLVRGAPTGEEFNTLVNPGMSIPASSIRFHGITDDMVVDAPSVPDAIRSFRTFVEGSVLVAHNAAFDMKFLSAREAETGVVFDNPVLDTLLVSFILQPNHSAHTLDAIAARFGVNISDEVRHTALGDARATTEIFVKMLPVLQRNGLGTLGRLLEASNRVFHIRREQERL